MNPAYHDVAAAQALGHRDVIAPPTFAFVVSMRASAIAMFDPGLGLDYSRVVHGEQRFAYARPVTAGDDLVVVTTIENIRVAAGNDILTTPRRHQHRRRRARRHHLGGHRRPWHRRGESA